MTVETNAAWRETAAEELAVFITDYFDEHLATRAHWAKGANNVTFAQGIINHLMDKLAAHVAGREEDAS